MKLRSCFFKGIPAPRFHWSLKEHKRRFAKQTGQSKQVDKIRHQLAWMKPYEYWDNPLPSGAGFVHLLYAVVVALWRALHPSRSEQRSCWQTGQLAVRRTAFGLVSRYVDPTWGLSFSFLFKPNRKGYPTGLVTHRTHTCPKRG